MFRHVYTTVAVYKLVGNYVGLCFNAQYSDYPNRKFLVCLTNLSKSGAVRYQPNCNAKVRLFSLSPNFFTTFFAFFCNFFQKRPERALRGRKKFYLPTYIRTDGRTAKKLYFATYINDNRRIYLFLPIYRAVQTLLGVREYIYMSGSADQGSQRRLQRAVVFHYLKRLRRTAKNDGCGRQKRTDQGRGTSPLHTRTRIGCLSENFFLKFFYFLFLQKRELCHEE